MSIKRMVASVVAALFTGWVLKVMWGWYMVPALGLPTLSLVPAIGIVLIAQLLTIQYIPRTEEELNMLIVFEFSVPTVTIVAGCILHLFM